MAQATETLRNRDVIARARRYAWCVGVPILIGVAISAVYGSNARGLLFAVPAAAIFIPALVLSVLAGTWLARWDGPALRAAQVAIPIAITYATVVTLQMALLALPVDLSLDRDIDPADPFHGLTFLGVVGSLLFGIWDAASYRRTT